MLFLDFKLEVKTELSNNYVVFLNAVLYKGFVILSQ